MRLASAQGRWVVAGAVLGSGAVFLEGSVVRVVVDSAANAAHAGMTSSDRASSRLVSPG